MSFQDIFKRSFLEGWAGTEIGLTAAVATMLVTSFLALYIFFVYRIMTRKTFYSKSFNISLAGVSVITAAIILTVQSSVVILAEIAVILSFVLTAGILILDNFPVARAPMILVVNAGDPDAEGAVMELAGRFARHPRVKSRNMTSDTLDLTVELRTDQGSNLLKGLMKIPGVRSAALLSHDGEVTF